MQKGDNGLWDEGKWQGLNLTPHSKLWKCLIKELWTAHMRQELNVYVRFHSETSLAR